VVTGIQHDHNIIAQSDVGGVHYIDSHAGVLRTGNEFAIIRVDVDSVVEADVAELTAAAENEVDWFFQIDLREVSRILLVLNSQLALSAHQEILECEYKLAYGLVEFQIFGDFVDYVTHN